MTIIKYIYNSGIREVILDKRWKQNIKEQIYLTSKWKPYLSKRWHKLTFKSHRKGKYI